MGLLLFIIVSQMVSYLTVINIGKFTIEILDLPGTKW